jgi:hypothetical protein
MKKNLSLLIAVIILFHFTGSFCQSFKLSGVSDMVRVFEDGYRLPPVHDSVNLFGIKGEILSGQFFITPGKSGGKASVQISELKSNSGRVLAGSVQWNFVGSIPLTENTPNQPSDHLIRKAPADFPDYLMEEKEMEIKPKTYKAVWLTVSIPGNAEAGEYTGSISVKLNNETRSLPLSVKVFPLVLPFERHLDIVEWYNTSVFGKIYGIREAYSPEWFAMLGKIAQNFAEHRQNAFQVPFGSIGITVNDSSEFTFDFSRFDQVADVFWNTGKMDILETGEIANFGKLRWAGTKAYLNDYQVRDAENGKVSTMAGRDVLPQLLPAFQEHLRAKGWLEKTIFGIRDEPSIHNAVSYNQASELVHLYAPDLRRFNALESTMVIDQLELAIPKLDHFANWYPKYREWQNDGHELWFYTVGIFQGSLFPNKTIDVPLIDSRIMHWLNYKYDATGYLHWGWNQWTDDPLHAVGQHIGDGWHVYPSKDGFMNALRWEEMRNGIQDYEYLWMLEDKISQLKNSLGSKFLWIDRKQRGKEIAGRVVFDFAHRTYDPDVLENAKKLLINELLHLEESPSLYVQTNPAENTEITSGSTVEVMVYSEPGAKIIINDKIIPESAPGLFLEQFGLNASHNKIIVKAENDGKSKTVVREFKIVQK